MQLMLIEYQGELEIHSLYLLDQENYNELLKKTLLPDAKTALKI
jgi:hypothetical protein